jgi:dihydrodipicolinate synthase/N-acetylneuraminate lyase
LGLDRCAANFRSAEIRRYRPCIRELLGLGTDEITETVACENLHLGIIIGRGDPVVITGVWTAFPQCYDRDDRALGKAIGHLFDQGVSGLFLLGTTGQGPDFTISERKSLTDRLLNLMPDPRHAVVAISANAASDVRELLQHAWQRGVRGVALTPPYYGLFAPEELVEWTATVFRNIPKTGEVYLYNMPLASPTRWSTPVITAIDEMIGIDGIKDSSSDVAQLRQYMRWSQGKNVSVLVGNERLTLYHYLNGGHGVVSGLSAAWPTLVVTLTKQCEMTQWSEARTTQAEVNRWLDEAQGSTLRASVRILVEFMERNGLF